MELNKSSLVPFQVNDPISGEDITNNIRLTAIEQGGVPSPYLKPNGDATFTVIAADVEDVTETTTFKLEVDYGGLPYELEASTDITVSGTTAGQFKVKFIEPAALTQVVEQNVEFYYDYQASYKGVYLGDGECQAHIPAPGVTPIDGVTLLREEVLADGITHRVWFKAALRTGNLVGLVVNVRRLPLVTPGVSGTDYVYATLRLKVIAAGSTELSIMMYDWNSVNIQGVIGADMISFFELYQGKTKLSLLDPTLSYTITDNGNMANPYNRLSFVTIPEGIRWTIKSLPSSSATPPLGGITLTIKKGSIQATQNLSVTVYPGSNNMFQTKFLIGPEANKKKNSVIQIGDYVSEMPYPWFEPANGVFESGTLTLKDIKTNAITQTVDLKGMSVNSINRLIVEQTASWMAQQAYFGPAVLKCPYVNKSFPSFYYVPVPMSHATFTVAESPMVFTPIPAEFNSLKNKETSIAIRAIQDRGDGPVIVPGTWTWRAGTSNITYSSINNTTDGGCILVIRGTGAIGDAQAGLNFTPTGGTTQQILVDLKAVAAGTEKVVVTAESVPCEVWDEFTAPPFKVSVGGTDVTANIRNVRWIPNTWFIETDKDDPNKWRIVHNVTALTRQSVYFTFEVQVDGVWTEWMGYGIYEIAAYDGIRFKNTVDYGRGVGVTTEIPVSRNNTNRFTVWPVYEAKPLTSGFSGTVQVGSWFTAPIRIVGPAEDGVGVIIEYTAPDTSGPASNACTLLLTIDGTPGTTTNQDRWAGNFTGIYVTKGLYVLPITLVPSTQTYARPYSWDAKIYYSGELLKPNDPRLSYEMSNAGVTPVIIDIVGIEDRYMWFAFNRRPDAAATFTNRIYVTYNDGVNPPEGSGYVNVQATYSTTATVPVSLKALKEPLGNAENIIPVEYQRSGNPIRKPTSILSFSGKDDPANGNALLGEVELIDLPDDIYRHELKFKSGWTGGKVIINMVAVFPDLADNWVLRDNELIVPPAVITVTPDKTSFEGFTGTSTEVKFTLSQDRLINDVVVPYDFSDATIASTATTTGPVQSVDAIKNANGEFSANFIGNGAEGDVTAEFTVTDADGFSYKVILAIEATVDSSGMTFALDKSSITGVAGYQETIPGTLLWNGSKLNMADGNINYTVEPAGYGQVVGKGANDITVRIIKNTAADETVECKVIANWSGRVADAPLTVNVQKNIEVTAKTYDVKVWDRVSGYPFTVKQGGTDITSQLLDIAHEPSEWLTDDTPLNWFDGNTTVGKPLVIITAEGEKPATSVTVPWSYRLPTEPVGVKHTVNIVYNVAEHNGWILTSSLVPFGSKEPLVIAINGTAEVDVVVLNKGKLVTTIATLGTAVTQEYATVINNSRFVSQIRLTLRAGVTEGYHGKQEHIVYPGALVSYGKEGIDYVVGKFEVNVWSSSAPFKLWSVSPNPVEGRYGDIVEIKAETFYQGKHIDVNSPNITTAVVTPPGTLNMVPNSRTKDGFSAEFVDDIQVNTKETDLIVSMKHANVAYSSTVPIKVKQTGLILKLTPAPGFQSTGQGDVDNPVTLTQSVLNPE